MTADRERGHSPWRIVSSPDGSAAQGHKRKHTFASLLLMACLGMALWSGCRQVLTPAETPEETPQVPVINDTVMPTSPTPVSLRGVCALAHADEIELGIADEPAVRAWMQAKRRISDPSKWVRSTRTLGEDTFIEYGWPEEFGGILARLKNGRLSALLKSDTWGPTFGELVDAVGPPEWVYPYIIRCNGSKDCAYGIYLDYPGLGMSVRSDRFGDLPGRTFALDRNLRVKTVECYVSGTMEEVLRNAYQLPPDYVLRDMQARVPWSGFGAIFSPTPQWP
jgi:hypothetical protein